MGENLNCTRSRTSNFPILGSCVAILMVHTYSSFLPCSARMYFVEVFLFIEDLVLNPQPRFFLCLASTVVYH